MIANLLIGFGLICVAAGLFGLIWCVRLARKVQAGAVPEAELANAFSRLSAVNMAAMGGAMLGLSMLVVGLIL